MRFAAISLVAAASIPLIAQERPTASTPVERITRGNYELAARWSPQKINKIVFDLGVEPRWFETADKFWYAFETTQGRRWFVVDPARKSKVPLFDNAKLAAALTGVLRIPYDAQHLPVQNARLIEKDTALYF